MNKKEEEEKDQHFFNGELRDMVMGEDFAVCKGGRGQPHVKVCNLVLDQLCFCMFSV